MNQFQNFAWRFSLSQPFQLDQPVQNGPSISNFVSPWPVLSKKFLARTANFGLGYQIFSFGPKWGNRCSARVTSARNNFDTNLWTSALKNITETPNFGKIPSYQFDSIKLKKSWFLEGVFGENANVPILRAFQRWLSENFRIYSIKLIRLRWFQNFFQN